MISMMASKRGYRDVENFSDDSEMKPEYYGLIAREKTFYISRYTNVNKGRLTTHKLTAKEAVQIQKDWKQHGWSLWFIEQWITGTVNQ